MKEIVVEPVEPTKDRTSRPSDVSAQSDQKSGASPTHLEIIDEICDSEAADDNSDRE